MSKMTHFNEQGHAKMVDISSKEDTLRTATALSTITVTESIYRQINENKNKKGDVFAVAQIAGIMAAKNTANIIPMCHPIMLTSININFDWVINESMNNYQIRIKSKVKSKGATGVEMEALVAVSAAALTIYDMCKAISKDMVIGETMLLNKSGGKSGDYHRDLE